MSAIKFGKDIGCKILGIVGKNSGYTAQKADECLVIPEVHADRVTPHAEEFQAVVWHLLVSHPKLKSNNTKWESLIIKQDFINMNRAVFLDRDGVINKAVIKNGKPYPPKI